MGKATESLRVYNRSRDRAVGRVRRADQFFTRLRGLLLTRPREEGLWLPGCQAVHMIGMNRPLDLVFLGRDLKVLKLEKHVMPFTPWVGAKGADSVLEFFTGQWDSSSLSVGDQLEIGPA